MVSRVGVSGGVPDERGLGLALRVAKVEDQGQVAVVDSDAGDIDDARNALLEVALALMDAGRAARADLGLFGQREHGVCLRVWMRRSAAVRRGFSECGSGRVGDGRGGCGR